MKTTVERPVSPRPLDGDDPTTKWVNDELLIILQQVRTAANARGSERTAASTAGTGAYTRLWTSGVMPSNAAWKVTADICGVGATGAARAVYLLTANFQSVVTAVSQAGATVTLDVFKSAVVIDARFGVDVAARTVFLEVRDDAVSPMAWVATPRTTEAFAG